MKAVYSSAMLKLLMKIIINKMRNTPMKKNNVLELKTQSTNTLIEDNLTNFMRIQAQKLLQVAVEQEVNEFVRQHQEMLPGGQQRVVLNGYLPERNIQTGIGDVAVKMPRVRDRATVDEKLVFTSNLVPKYMRRTVTLDVALPLLYLNGVSSNKFPAALSAFLGDDAKNLSPNVISKLKHHWYNDYEAWQQRDLSKKRYVYWWVDGVYLKARMEGDKTCMLVIVGADEYGNKELVAMTDGYRENKASWLSLLRQLKQQGLTYAPQVAVGDGALGFWGALTEIYPTTKQQRCWVHKTANILEKLPKSQQQKAKAAIHDIYLSATREDALSAYQTFIDDYQLKYSKAVDCLTKDKEQLFAFYDFPAEHWVHLRTTNPIESTFATVRHRTKLSKNCCARKTIIAATFKLMTEAEKRWKKLNGAKRLAQIIHLEKFVDGVHIEELKQHQLNKAA